MGQELSKAGICFTSSEAPSSDDLRPASTSTPAPAPAPAPTTGPSSSITYGDKIIPVSSDLGINPEHLEKVLKEYKPFQEWLARLNHGPRFVLRKIHIQTIDLFGPRIGFVKFRLDIVNEQGKFVPGIVFMRGGAVAVLVVLECDEEVNGHREWTLLTVQPRVPLGDFECVELPAGMIDGNGNFAGVAAKEMKEETELEMEPEHLIDLTQLAWQDKFPGMLPSPGGCDEFLRLYLYKRKITSAELRNFEGKATGQLAEGEMIKLKVMPLADLWKNSADSKALCALYLYQKLKENGLVE